MLKFEKAVARTLNAILALCLCLTAAPAQQAGGALRGQVTDEFGAAIVGASLTLEAEGAAARTARTDGQGYYAFNGIAAGRYKLAARAEGFAVYENEEVEVGAGRATQLNFKLGVAMKALDVTVVDGASEIGVDPETDASSLVLKGAELESLPDDPEELAATLQVMSGSAGASGGGQFYLDGFQASKLPPKRNIREVRINQNPFSAEYDRLGTNRIDIFTKPGTERFHGQAFFTFNDESLNARDPFAASRAPFQTRLLSGGLSGPAIKGSSSFFLDFERREIDDNALVRATILDSSLGVSSFNQSVVTPQRRSSFNLRFDQKLNRSNTLVARYSFFDQGAANAGVGGFSLPGRAFGTSQGEHRLQLTETDVLGPNTVNEARLQLTRESLSLSGDNSAPTINVLDAFVDGGPAAGGSRQTVTRWELQDYVFRTLSGHTLKAGVQLNGVSLEDVSRRNFGGTFTFAGGVAARLDERGQVVYAGGGPSLVPLTSLERYRRTLLFARQGLPANAGSLTPGQLGYGPSQFSIIVGDPSAAVSQLEFASFVQDDWKVRPNLTLSAGLRYEAQTNAGDKLDFAPRFRFAWAPGGSANQQRRTVIRGGIGVFYDRFDEDLTLQAVRFDGTRQQQLVVTDPSTLQAFPLLPALSGAGAALVPQTLVRVAEDLRAPYTIQTALGVDRQLPHNISVSATYLNARTLHQLRSRNVNAPLPGTYAADLPQAGVRPLGVRDNVFLYESSGRVNQHQLLVRLNGRLSRDLMVFGTYVLNKAESDTDGPSSFPANSYDLSTEYGRSALDVRQHLFVGGTFNAPWGLHLNPFLVASSGRPFNITTGRDSNGDTLYTERPAFADDPNKPGVLVTRFGAFDPNPAPGQTIIPRNYGTGPSLFVVNLRVSKTVGFGGGTRAAAGAANRKGSGDFTEEAAGAATAGAGEKRYSLTFSLRVQNLFNRVNAAAPVGNLSSLLFGESTSSAGSFNFGGGNPAAGNRRVEAQVGFTF